MSLTRYKNIDNLELSQLLHDGAAIVDVRRYEEWQETGVVAGSELLTFFAADGSSKPAEWLEQLNQRVGVDQPLVLI